MIGMLVVGSASTDPSRADQPRPDPNTARPRCKNRVTRSSGFGEVIVITVTFSMTTIPRTLMEGVTRMARRHPVGYKYAAMW